jgi:hypothetical protein
MVGAGCMGRRKVAGGNASACYPMNARAFMG